MSMWTRSRDPAERRGDLAGIGQHVDEVAAGREQQVELARAGGVDHLRRRPARLGRDLEAPELAELAGRAGVDLAAAREARSSNSPSRRRPGRRSARGSASARSPRGRSSRGRAPRLTIARTPSSPRPREGSNCLLPGRSCGRGFLHPARQGQAHRRFRARQGGGGCNGGARSFFRRRMPEWPSPAHRNYEGGR